MHPRLVRDAHVGALWEGTSNIVALDIDFARRRQERRAPGARHWLHDASRGGEGVARAVPQRLRRALERATALPSSVAADPGRSTRRVVRRARSTMRHRRCLLAFEAPSRASMHGARCWRASCSDHRLSTPRSVRPDRRRVRARGDRSRAERWCSPAAIRLLKAVTVPTSPTDHNLIKKIGEGRVSGSI